MHIAHNEKLFFPEF